MAHPVSILRGIKDALGPGVEVTYARGCPLAVNATDTFGPSSPDYQQALAAAKNADVVIYVGGISARLEGEEMRVTMVGFTGGDRTRIELPQVQEDLLKALSAVGKPVVFVNCSGSAMAIPWEADHLAAILQAWYPGQNGGTAVADVLLGRYNPAGPPAGDVLRVHGGPARLPGLRMANRTYRYFSGQGAVSVRLRPELHEVLLRQAAIQRSAARPHGHAPDHGAGPQHGGAGRR